MYPWEKTLRKAWEGLGVPLDPLEEVTGRGRLGLSAETAASMLLIQLQIIPLFFSK